MELVLLCLSLLVQHGLAQVNLGFNLSPDAPEIFDGDFSTCKNYGGREIKFKHSIDIDTIRIHRENKGTGRFDAYVYPSGQSVETWNLPQFNQSTEGATVVASFRLQTGVTAIKIIYMKTACEVELTNEQALPPKEIHTPTPALVCNHDTCNQHGTCKDDRNRAVCRCEPGYTGEKCESEQALPPTETPTLTPVLVCNRDSCNQRGRCENKGNRAVCRCKPGYTGEKCESEMFAPLEPATKSPVCTPEYCQREGTCRKEGNRRVCVCNPGRKGPRCGTSCPRGKYGQNCSFSCSRGCTNSNGCNKKTGRCTTCRTGWTSLDTHHRCDKECTAGHYGQDCRQECSEGCMDKYECNHVDGSCTCKPGWRGRDCSQVCSKGWYGDRCSGYCPVNCKDRECNHVDGSCLCKPGLTGAHCNQRCPPGTYGQNCSSSCSPGCKYKRCDRETGRCTYGACEAGWTNSDNNGRCDRKQCSPGCAGVCDSNGRCDTCKPGWTHSDSHNRLCDKKCAPGHYGAGCQQTCSSGCSGFTCNHVTGRCSCNDGWTGETCNQCVDGYSGTNCRKCSEGCADICNKANGACSCKAGWTGTDCSQECLPGHYGPGCQQTCRFGCLRNTCHHMTGFCPCKAGWTGEQCEECEDHHFGQDCLECSEGCADTCDKTNGDCTCKAGWRGGNCSQDCPAGKYGQGCESTCNEGCDPHKCDPATGDCTGHCKEGWTGHNCKHQCPRGSYGLNCSSSCSPGCEYGLCDPVEGECYDETCKAGWKHLSGSLKRCDEKCASGMYGENCSLNCSRGCSNRTCDPVSGVCAKCIQGWELDPVKSTSCVLGLANKRLGKVFNQDDFPLIQFLYLMVPISVIFSLRSSCSYVPSGCISTDEMNRHDRS